MRDVTIAAVEEADLGELLTLQRAAYISEARLYGDWYLPPLVETMEQLAEAVRSGVALKAALGHRMVGSVRARVHERTGRIGRLVVAPDLQGGGLGTRLLAEIEHLVSRRVDRFELFTGPRSEGNLTLYRRAGYRATRTQRMMDGGRSLIYLQKPNRV